jgi:hypothetical protein
MLSRGYTKKFGSKIKKIKKYFAECLGGHSAKWSLPSAVAWGTRQSLKKKKKSLLKPTRPTHFPNPSHQTPRPLPPARAAAPCLRPRRRPPPPPPATATGSSLCAPATATGSSLHVPAAAAGASCLPHAPPPPASARAAAATGRRMRPRVAPPRLAPPSAPRPPRPAPPSAPRPPRPARPPASWPPRPASPPAPRPPRRAPTARVKYFAFYICFILSFNGSNALYIIIH